VPVVLDIAERARRLAAPGAWIVDFTNPVGIVTRALIEAGHRALRYYYMHDAVVAELLGAETRAHQVAGLERRLLEIYADPALDHKPELLAQRGGAFYSEAAADLLASLVAGTGDVQVVNVRNNGTLPFLADDAAIEVPARVGASGAVPLPVAPIEPLYADLIAHVTAYEALALEAALRGGRGRVVDALLAHPLIGQYDQATKPADRLIAENVPISRGSPREGGTSRGTGDRRGKQQDRPHPGVGGR
jgi:alpha-galactosidase/6-phospho-beta-glucosidase family protein